MNRKFVLCAAVVVLALTTTATSFASLRSVAQGDQIKLFYNSTRVPYRTGTGGEFVMDMISPNAQTNYTHAFCAEVGEYIYDGETVTVQSVGTTTLIQGNTLTAGAAKLFRDYMEGIAANGNGYGFTPTANFTLASGMTYRLTGGNSDRAADGRSVQLALWRMIGATSGSTGNTNADNLYAYYSTNFSGTGDGNYYGVRFANLVGSTLRNGTTNRQDQFVIIPEPGSLLIWGGSIGLAGFFTRRRKVA